MSTARVVFSLDFELGWGHRHSRPAYVERLRAASDVEAKIRALVDAFDQHDVPATWAVVGKLLEPGDDELLSNQGLFEYVLDSRPAHEIALHSHEHVPYTVLSRSDADEDIEAGSAALGEWDIEPTSFVYPQDKLAHTDLLAEYGIECYRTPTPSPRDELSTLWRPHLFTVPEAGSGPVRLPGSILLAASPRPAWYRRWYARKGLRDAIAANEVVHYWLHPHNVVTNPDVLPAVEDLLRHVDRRRREGDVEVCTMAQFAVMAE